jgi:hypothetical protein
MIFYCTKLHVSKCNVSWVVSIKQNTNPNFQPRSTFEFLPLVKMFLLKVVPHIEDRAAYKSSSSHVDRCKFCIHIRSLNVSHSEATGLELWRRGQLQCHDPSSEFRKDLLIGSKVIRGNHRWTHRQNGGHISLNFFLKNCDSFPPSLSYHRGSPYLYVTWGMNNRPLDGCSSETVSPHWH